MGVGIKHMANKNICIFENVWYNEDVRSDELGVDFVMFSIGLKSIAFKKTVVI